MSATRFDAAILALIGLYEGAPALEGIPVYDGPVPMTASDTAYVVVGHDGSVLGDGSLNPNPTDGTFTQQDYAMGPLREENGFIGCVIVCQSGDPADKPGQRAKATALLQAAEDAAVAKDARTSPAGLIFLGTSDGRWMSRQSANGVAVLLAYRVAYQTGY